MVLAMQFVLAGPVFAQSGQISNQGEAALEQLQAAGGSQGANLGDVPQDPRLIAARMIRIFLSLLGIIFLAMTIYAGFLWMTAGGETDKLDKAKKLLYNGVIGLAIIFAAYAITYFVIRVALQIPTDPMYDIHYF